MPLSKEERRKKYAYFLEVATGFTIEETKNEEGEECFFLVDPYGDRFEDCFYCFEDLVYTTEDEVLDAVPELINFRLY